MHAGKSARQHRRKAPETRKPPVWKRCIYSICRKRQQSSESRSAACTTLPTRRGISVCRSFTAWHLEPRRDQRLALVLMGLMLIIGYGISMDVEICALWRLDREPCVDAFRFPASFIEQPHAHQLGDELDRRMRAGDITAVQFLSGAYRAWALWNSVSGRRRDAQSCRNRGAVAQHWAQPELANRCGEKPTIHLSQAGPMVGRDFAPSLQPACQRLLVVYR